jgi:hypothetical protein
MKCEQVCTQADWKDRNTVQATILPPPEHMIKVQRTKYIASGGKKTKRLRREEKKENEKKRKRRKGA